ncbi:MAG: rod shape-determining protein RodA [Haliscomenobacteraceae bacterium CHB4]|nr:putative lipid II flippase FtsW [Saprospiraceae bacterium]MCE7922379.1 rod shape-determining protein RodA [Haliscomenobacteraceae bacterium CHB4]
MAAPKRTTFAIGDIDKRLVWLYLALVTVGWLMIYSVNYNPNLPTLGIFDLSNNAGKQMLFILVCFALIFVIMMTDWAFWRTYSFIIYLVTIILLPGTLIFGREVNGALAWYQFGGFSFQPSELAKFGTCLALAGYLSSTGVDLRTWKSRITAFLIFLVPVGIILAQSDTGSALIFFSFFLVLYREGLSWTWYFLGGIVVLSVIFGLAWNPAYVMAVYIWIYNFTLLKPFRDHNRVWWTLWGLTITLTICWPLISPMILETFGKTPEEVPNLDLYMLAPHFLLASIAFFYSYWRKNSLIQNALLIRLSLLLLACGLVFAANFASTQLLAPHQQQRINVWLNPSKTTAADARGSAYNMLHSKMAIGSGGFIGKGYLDGNMTKLKYVPEQTTDFIFCTVGEEHGFLGVTIVVGLFAYLLYYITIIAERQRSNFSRVYAYCVAGIIFIHFIVNIGMTMGLFPIIGIPLPFLSYGGSSLIGFSLMIGVLLKLDSNRNLA